MNVISFDQIDILDYKSNEAFKTLRTNLQYCGENIKIICFTSCLPSEGKSNVSFHLAVSFTESGKRVAFIDADLRSSLIIDRYKPNHEVFGLTDYLIGYKRIEEVLYNTNISNLDVIFTGSIPPNPAELLGHERFKMLLSILREVYDVVIIDTPPVGSVIDSVIVSKNCDGTILVIQSKMTSYRFAQKVKMQLDQVGSKVLGVVLNKCDKKTNPYWNYNRRYKKYDKNYLRYEK
jgi:capsular exopolysaccharide synthesis family protein